MADKSIGSLPAAPQLDDDSLLAVEQQGEARKFTGRQFKEFGRAGVADYVDSAAAAADRAQASADAAKGHSDQAAAHVQQAIQYVQQAADKAQESADSAADAAQSAQDAEIAVSHYPRIGENENWEIYQDGEYQDTGKPARGEPGKNFRLLGYYPTIQDLEIAVPNPEVGDTYGIGTAAPYDIYIYSDTEGWVDNGQLQGPPGEQGEQGPIGATGPQGPQGPAGEGVPAGGTAGQVLTKKSDVDYDAEWVEAPEGGVTSFNGRAGAIVPQAGDYTAEQVGALPLSGGTMSGDINISGTNVGIVSVGVTNSPSTILQGPVPYNNTPYHFRFSKSTFSSCPLLTYSTASANVTNPVRVSGVKTPDFDNDAANKKYVDDKAAAYLPLAGGTMTGELKMKAAIDLASFSIKNASMVKFNGLGGILFSKEDGFPGIFNHPGNTIDYADNAQRVSGVADPLTSHDAANKQYVDTQINTRAPTSHNHSASNITSGAIPTARGGTGATSPQSAIGNLVGGLDIETTIATDDTFPFRDASASTGKKISFANLRNAVVSAWAQAVTKPTYTASEVGALPITGGTLTGNLRIKGSGNYGMKLNLGDGDYVYLYEPTDDCLEIKGNKQINLVTQKLLLNGEEFSGGGGKIVTGTYVGNAELPSQDSSTLQSFRTINIGFKPKLVFVLCLSVQYNHVPWSLYDYDTNEYIYVYSNYAYDGYPFKSIQGASNTNEAICLQIESNGFSVRNARFKLTSRRGFIHMNQSSYTYAYFAIG